MDVVEEHLTRLKIWDVSLQLGGNGNQEEKVLAGDIAIDNML